jgi:hypothetical protein
VDEARENQVENPQEVCAQDDAKPKRRTPTPDPRSRLPRSGRTLLQTRRRTRPPSRSSGGSGTAVKVGLALVSVVALEATGYAYATKGRLQNNVHTTDALTQPDEPAPPADDGATDILLVGSDARTDAQGNPLPLSVLKALRTEEGRGQHRPHHRAEDVQGRRQAVGHLNPA